MSNTEVNSEKGVEVIEKAKINLETAKFPWRELQRFFAAGQVFIVDQRLDMTSVALMISQDNVSEIEKLINQKKTLLAVSDEQAMQWYEEDASLWCVVVKPFILVQTIQA